MVLSKINDKDIFEPFLEVHILFCHLTYKLNTKIIFVHKIMVEFFIHNQT